ncbi:MAG: homoserine O-succinyltransferase [Chitinophagaceae bacterium]|nr:homoserine O-succinyltransferase [Chitinophagaceae bacterium]
MHAPPKIRIAILDLYAGQLNQGMRCIREILSNFERENNLSVETASFEVRQKNEVPDLSYDIYISTGGPGSPLDSEGSPWELAYFEWLRQVEDFNLSAKENTAKHVFFICHSFELVCRHYKLAQVCKRKSAAFGVFPVHLTPHGKNDPVFSGLEEPFYAMESRSFQVIAPDAERLEEMGSIILAFEKERPHVPLDRAIVAIRFNKYMIGTQFHPEADALGTSRFLKRKDKKLAVIKEYGEEKWKDMILHLNDPAKIRSTYSHVLPNFLRQCIQPTSKQLT